MDDFLDHYHCYDCGADGSDVNEVGVFYACFRVEKTGVIEIVFCPECAAKKQGNIIQALREVAHGSR